MSYPQQPQNDPNQYPQQPSYPQTPSSGTPSINMGALTAPENRPYLIAGVGGLIAFLGYFIFPYYSVSYHFESISNSATLSGSQIGSWLVLSMLGGLVALVVAAVLALGIRAIPQLTPQLGARVLLGAAGASIIGLVIFLLQAGSATSDLGLTGISSGVTAGVALGFWIAVLATIAMIVGGVMSMRRTA